MYGEPIAAECGPVRRPPYPLGAQPRCASVGRRPPMSGASLVTCRDVWAWAIKGSNSRFASGGGPVVPVMWQLYAGLLVASIL